MLEWKLATSLIRSRTGLFYLLSSKSNSYSNKGYTQWGDEAAKAGKIGKRSETNARKRKKITG
jgi:hypothetical protein